MEIYYPVCLIGAHISTETVDVSQLITIDTRSISLQLTMQVIVSWLILSGSHRCIQRCSVQCCVPRWMVGLDGVCSGSLVTTVAELIWFGYVTGRSVDILNHIAHLPVDRILAIAM